MEYRLGAHELMNTLTGWDETIPGRGKIHLIACGGTALTLLGYIDLKKLEGRYKETAQYDVSEEKVLKNYEVLRSRLKGGSHENHEHR